VRIELRVAAVTKRRKKILFALHKKGGESYWVLPGGRVKFGETLEEALEREFKEETGACVKVGRLLMVNDFLEAGRRRHVLNIYFLARPLGRIALDRDFHHKTIQRLSFLSEQEIRSENVRPNITREILTYLASNELSRIYVGRR